MTAYDNGNKHASVQTY